MSAPTYDVQVQLIGQDGNAFAIIGAVAGAIRREVGSEESQAFVAEAVACDSYDSLLMLAARTVHVS